MLRTAFLRSRQRMTAHKSDALGQAVFEAANDGRLGAAGIGQKRTGLAERGAVKDLLDDAIDRRTEHGDVCLTDGRGEVDISFIDSSDCPGSVEAVLLPAD